MREGGGRGRVVEGVCRGRLLKGGCEGVCEGWLWRRFAMGSCEGGVVKGLVCAGGVVREALGFLSNMGWNV